MKRTKVIIVAPSLDTFTNVSGVATVANYIIMNNSQYVYEHFQQGKSDNGKDGEIYRIWTIIEYYYLKRILNA